MADGYYNSPGAAASDAVTELLMQRQQLARQGAMDRLAFMKFQQDQEQANAALKEKQQEHQDLIDLKDESTTRDIIGKMQIGDIPDADLIAKAKKYHIPVNFTTPPVPQAVSQPGEVMPPAAPEGIAAPDAAPASPVAMTGMPATPDRAPIRFAGTHLQQEAATKEDRLADLRKIISTEDPATPKGRSAVLEYEMLSNKAIPAGLIKAPTEAKVEGVFRQSANPKTGVSTIERHLNGQWIPWPGDVPAGSHWETMPQPKDTSLSDQAHTDRENYHLDTIRHDTTQSINANPLVKNTEDQINTLNKLDLSLRQNNNLGDSVIAEQVLKLTAGGQGSGLRLNNVLIDRILKDTRTKWDTLQLKLQAWGGDPNKPLILDPDQREAIRKLAAEGRKIANDTHAKIIATRRKVHAATDASSIWAAEDDLYEALGKGGGDTSGPLSATDLINKAKVKK